MLFGLSTSALAAFVHCDGADRDEPLNAFGNGTRFDGGTRDATTSGGNGSSNGGTSGGEDLFEPEDPGEGEGLSNTGTDEPTPGSLDGETPGIDGYPPYPGQDGGGEDGGVAGGVGEYNKYAEYPGGCPVIETGAFACATKRGQPGVKATVYLAPITNVPQLVNDRFQFILASDFGGVFPLGFWDPPLLPPGTPKMRTYPFPKCKRCVTVTMTGGGSDKLYMAVGGVLSLSPFPFPTRGTMEGRVDWAVLLEHQKGSGDTYRPVPGGKCLRAPRVRISVRESCPNVAADAGLEGF